MRFNRTHPQPIGLDVGHDSVKLLQVQTAGESTIRAVAAARHYFPADVRSQPAVRVAAAVEPIRKMLRDGDFVGRRVVAALPREIVHVKNFRLPSMPEPEMDAAVRFETPNLFGFDAADGRVQWVQAGEVRQGTDVLQELIVLATRNDEVDAFVEQVHRCGLVIDSLDAEPMALFRGVERFIRRRDDEAEVHVLVDVGLNATQVVIGKGRSVSFLKTIEVGGVHLQTAISKRLGISMDEAESLRRRLCESGEREEAAKRDPVRQAVFDATRSTIEQLGRELALCMRYHSVTFRGYRPQRLRLLGGESSDANLRQVLSAVLTIPVEPGRPLFTIDAEGPIAAERRGGSGEWAVALGLALRRTTGRYAPKDGRPRGAPLPLEQALAAEAVATAAGAPMTEKEEVHA